MKFVLPTALVLALSCAAHSSSAQVLPPLPPGGYYISCPTGLNSIFNMYGYVEYQGHQWSSEWRATKTVFPLSSFEWYRPVPYGAVLTSTDGRATWSNAQVRVLCWIYNGMDIIVRHYDPMQFSGTVKECSTGGGTEITNPIETSYDPYTSYPPTNNACSNTSGGGGGGSGGSNCHDEYVYIEESTDGGVTWTVLWEGWAIVCV